MGILADIYRSLTEEQQLIIDYQAYAGERIACLCKNISTNQIEKFNEKYSIIRIQPQQTKARYRHICIIPIQLAEKILHVAKTTKRENPFPNYESIWREITKLAKNKYGVRLTSHYLRKRFHSIAQKTPMPINDWDFLMGDKMEAGHHANTYTLEDWSDLITEYDRFLAPYLSIAYPKDPQDAIEPSNATNQLGQVLEENRQLKEEILKLSKLIAAQVKSQ